MDRYILPKWYALMGHLLGGILATIGVGRLEGGRHAVVMSEE